MVGKRGGWEWYAGWTVSATGSKVCRNSRFVGKMGREDVGIALQLVRITCSYGAT